MSRPFIIKQSKSKSDDIFKQMRKYEEFLEFQEIRRLKQNSAKEVKKEEKKEERKGLFPNVSKGELTAWMFLLSPFIGAGVTQLYISMWLYTQHALQQVIK